MGGAKIMKYYKHPEKSSIPTEEELIAELEALK